MLIIKISPFFLPEKRYIIQVLFEEFLNLKVQIIIKEGKEWEISLPSKKTITFADTFFSSCKDRNYLSVKNIPIETYTLKNKFSAGKEIAVIYGGTETKISENEIYCEADIFASAFFMLTRWEEYANPVKDNFGRLADHKQLSVKQGFSKTPVVNEYTEMLRNMLLYFGFLAPNIREFKALVTHDIDFFEKYSSNLKVIKSLGGDLLKRKSIKLALKTFKQIVQIKQGKLADPFNTFDELMTLSEKNNLQSHFYFIPGKKGEDDAQYNIGSAKLQAQISEIKIRGHKVGLHASFGSFNKSERFLGELVRLQKQNSNIEGGRQHYLRFANPNTWQIWENAGLKYDSTIGFINQGGFRAGTCYPYSVFNILTRKKLTLKERPLIVMDTAIARQNLTYELLLKELILLINEVRRYNGEFVLLWHNSNLNAGKWVKYKPVYEKIITEFL